jgi:hypothetical protein
MRWKRLVAALMLVTVLAVPSTAGAAVALEDGPSIWSSGFAQLVEMVWNRLSRLAASETPVAPGTSTDGGPGWDPDGATTFEPEDGDAPAAEGGPEWDPNGTS